MRTIQHKYNPGDRLYYIGQHNVPVEGKCPFCLGYGEFIRQGDGTLVKCKDCHGTGKKTIGYNTTYQVFNGYVGQIRIVVDEFGVVMRYEITEIDHRGGSSQNIKEEDLYDNIEVATRECESLNNKGAMGSRGTYGTT